MCYIYLVHLRQLGIQGEETRAFKSELKAPGMGTMWLSSVKLSCKAGHSSETESLNSIIKWSDMRRGKVGIIHKLGICFFLLHQLTVNHKRKATLHPKHLFIHTHPTPSWVLWREQRRFLKGGGDSQGGKKPKNLHWKSEDGTQSHDDAETQNSPQ